MKTATPKTEPAPSTQLQKAAFGGSQIPISPDPVPEGGQILDTADCTDGKSSLSRRQFLGASAVCSLAAAVVGGVVPSSASAADLDDSRPFLPKEDLLRLGTQFKDLLQSKIAEQDKINPASWPPRNLLDTASPPQYDYRAAAYPQIVTLADGGVYEKARQTYNIRYQRYPAVIFYALDAEQVRQAVLCARQLNLKVSPAGCRNSFQSMAVPDGAVVIDLSHMNAIALKVEGDESDWTCVAGPGTTGPNISAALREANLGDIWFPSGVCGFVGVVPYVLGGGLGFQGHRMGLCCDSLVEVEMVLADGTVVKANESSNQDLFWACCGGGGGTFGIVTSLTISVNRLPNEGKLVAFKLIFLGKKAFVDGFDAWQNWFPTADRLWAFDEPRMGAVTSGTPDAYWSVLIQYYGSTEAAVTDLIQAGLLFDLRTPANPDGSVILQPTGRNGGSYDDHQTWYFENQCAMWMGAEGMPGSAAGLMNALNLNGFGQPYMVDSMRDPRVMQAIYGAKPLYIPGPPAGGAPNPITTIPSSPFLGTQVIGGSFYHVNQYVVNRFLDKVPVKTLQAVAEFFYTNSVKYIKEGSIAHGVVYAGGHFLGGAYADRRPSDTAFFWREKLMVLYFSFALPPGAREMVSDEQFQLGKELTDQLLHLFCPAKTPKQAAYVNYQQERFENWEYGYFGDNYPVLQKIKRKYDPYGVFNKAFTVGAGKDRKER
jgi:FAD/FMN-containing dehydrogenase